MLLWRSKRLIVSIGVLGLGLVSVWRMGFTPDMAFIQMAGPMLLTGVFLMMFIIPVTGLCMASVDPDEQEDSAGISNFMRVLGGAFATSLVQTGWTNAARQNQAELTGAMTQGQATLDGMMASGAPPEAARTLLAGLLEGQSYMLATLNVFAAIAICFAFAATLIWFVPKPKGPINTSGGH